MRKKKFNSIEALVKKHYMDKRELEFLKNKIKRIQREIKDIEDRINRDDIIINLDIKSPSINGQISSRGAYSKIDMALEKAYMELEKRLKTKINDEIIIINKIYELEDNIDELGQVIDDLKLDLREIIEKIYRDKESIKFIALESYGGALATVHRKRNKALEEIKNMLMQEL